MTHRFHVLLGSPLLALAVAAQEPNSTPRPDFAPKAALVGQALATCDAAPSLGFATKLKVESQFTRAMRGRGASGNPAATATWAENRLHVVFDDGADEAVFSERRMIARAKDGAWALHSGKLADGRPLPHVLEPQTFFRALASAQLQILSAEVGALDDHPVEIVTAHLEGDPAHELSQAGVLPESNELGSMVVFRAGGVGRMAPPKGDLEVDFAFYVDPATKRLLRIKIRAYSKAAGGGAGAVFVANVGGGGGGEEEEEEETATEAKSKGAETLKLKDGLPVRSKAKKENWTITTYEVDIKDIGSTKPVELDPAAKALLTARPGR